MTFKKYNIEHNTVINKFCPQDQAFESPVRHGDGSSGIGNLLGWAMAAIYMGGRLPQICLNVSFCYINGLFLISKNLLLLKTANI